MQERNALYKEIVGLGIERESKVVMGDSIQCTTPPDLRPRPTLRYGSKGEHVEYLQRRLNCHRVGYEEPILQASAKFGSPKEAFKPLKPDGIFGTNTLKAVKVFQKARNLEKIDGIVGKYTWPELNSFRKSKYIPVGGVVCSHAPVRLGGDSNRCKVSIGSKDPAVDRLLKALKDNTITFPLNGFQLTPEQQKFMFEFFLIGSDECAQHKLAEEYAVFLVAHTGVETAYAKSGSNPNAEPKFHNYFSMQPSPVVIEEYDNKKVCMSWEHRDTYCAPTPQFCDIRECIKLQLEIAYGIASSSSTGFKNPPYPGIGGVLKSSGATGQAYCDKADKGGYSKQPYRQLFPKTFGESQRLILAVLDKIKRLQSLYSETKTWVDRMRDAIALLKYQ